LKNGDTIVQNCERNVENDDKQEGAFMRIIYKKLLAILMVLVMTLGMVSFNAVAVNANVDIAAGDTVAIVQDKMNTALETSGVTTISVTGGNSSANTILRLNIPSGVTVKWEATYRGTANPVIDISGSGTFEVVSGAWIQNTSTANSFTSVRANESIDVIVSGGMVQAGRGRAIEGAGAGTIVTVTGGTVFNAATNNLFPCIDMSNSGNTGLNVIVNGGAVHSDPDPSGTGNIYGYVIQTYGNVDVMNGEVYTTGPNGRGINLVGPNSKATVTGGKVYATGVNGDAISTATTPGVVVTSTEVIVTGGLVASFGTGSSWAIHTTGTNSNVSVTGGCVFGFGNSIHYGGASATTPAAINSVIFTQGRTTGVLTLPTTSGVVIAWTRPTGTTTQNKALYFKNTTQHIITAPEQPETHPTPPYAVWANPLPGYRDDGIAYNFPGGNGFIPLPEVEVVAATYAIETILLTLDGTIVPWHPSPSYMQVPYGENRTFSITPNPGYSLTYIQVYNPVPFVTPILRPTLSLVGTTYELRDVKQNYVIAARFDKDEDDEYTIVAYAGMGGSISPQGFERVYGTPAKTYTITANGGYHISGVVVNGASVAVLPASPYIYSIPAITRNYVITATFAPNPHTITATVGRGGRIIADGGAQINGGTNGAVGTFEVPHDSNPVFTIVPNPGWSIDTVLVDGVPRAPSSVQEITNVISNDRTIHVTFAQTPQGGGGGGGVVGPTTYDIEVIALIGGTVTPSDGSAPVTSNSSRVITVPEGAGLGFTITPNPGYRIQHVMVDGANMGAISAINGPPFDAIKANHRIMAVFEPDDGESNGPNGPRDLERYGDNDVSQLLLTDRHIQYIHGYPGNVFRPERNMSRAEVAQMFYNLLVEPEVRLTRRFPDEFDDAWHAQAVHTLASIGIISGRPDGNFYPQSSITRAEFCAMAVRFAQQLPSVFEDNPFSDVSEGHWAYNYIYSAHRFGWIVGYGDGSFRPGEKIRRSEVVTIVNRMLQRVPDAEYIDSHTELIQFYDVSRSHWAYYAIMEAYHAHLFDRDPDGSHEHWHD
jgi:hypothetical protein